MPISIDSLDRAMDTLVKSIAKVCNITDRDEIYRLKILIDIYGALYHQKEVLSCFNHMAISTYKIGAGIGMCGCGDACGHSG